MAKADSIPPFPSDIDRDIFGHWLSGFTDGEGCFHLYCQPHFHHGSTYSNPTAGFCIALRADDLTILEQIRMFFACGIIRLVHKRETKKRPGHPVHDYRVNKIGDLVQHIIPHFSRYPLRAKKARDFAIWKEGVALLAQVSSQPFRKKFGYRNGWARKWKPDLVAKFESFRDALKLQRVYQAPVITPVAHKEPPSLFDNLP